MSAKRTRFLGGIAIVAFLVSPALFLNANVESSYRVKDGDSFIYNGMEYRLWGIDAPELFQKCFSGGAEYSCGQKAKSHLLEILSGGELRCVDKPKARRETRIVAQCSINGQDIASSMVVQGWALDYTYFSKGYYSRAQAEAKSKKLGIWSGTFIIPREWRKSKRKN